MEFCCLLVYHANFIGKGTCYLGNFAIFASVFNKCWFYSMGLVFEIRDKNDNEIAKSLIREYSTIKGAEQCFVSLDKELADLDTYYYGGAFMIGYKDDFPVATLAIRKIDDNTCELKRLYVKPDYRGRGYSRLLVDAALDRARNLGFQEVRLTTKPAVMPVAYGYYKRIGFEELGNENGTVSMSFSLTDRPGILEF